MTNFIKLLVVFICCLISVLAAAQDSIGYDAHVNQPIVALQEIIPQAPTVPVHVSFSDLR